MAKLKQARKGGKIERQHGPVRLRLVQSVGALNAQGIPVPPGPTTTVLGQAMVPSWSGINDRTGQGRGWLDGQYERRLKEEGSATITLPNDVGSDGVLHRERFLSIDETAYRFGDEWIEVYRASAASGPGDLLAVCAPIQAALNETTIVLTCFDAFYTLKKHRETTAGFWANAPRDVFEEYTKAWSVWIADGFDAAAIASKWSATADVTVGPTPSCIRLNATGAASNIASVATIPLGPGSSNKSHTWRLEAALSFPTLPTGTDQLYVLLSAGAGSFGIEVSAGGTVTIYTVANGVQFSQLSTRPPLSPGSHSFAVEGRHRWVYYYVDGVCVGVLPLGRGNDVYNMSVTVDFVTAAVGQPNYYVDVDYLLLWLRQPYLMRSGSDLGDYTLPGAPTGSGLLGKYHDDGDLAADANMGYKQLNPLRAAPSAGGRVIVARVDPAVAFTAGLGAWPPGGLLTDRFSVRWQGAIYLDLANYDYSIVASATGWRLWVGKTRASEQLVDNWTYGNASGGTIAQATGSLRAVLGNVSGWYPIIFEAQGLPGVSPQASAVLGYTRSDIPQWVGHGGQLAIPLNVGGYPHAVIATGGLVHYFLLNDWTNDAGVAIDLVGTDALSLNGGSSSPQQLVTGPVPNENAITLNTVVGSQYFAAGTSSTGNTGAYTAATIEAWVEPTALVAATTYTIAYKKFVWQIYYDNGAFHAQFGDGTAFQMTVSGGTPLLNQWQHVAATYDGTTARLFVNGVLVGSTVHANGLGNNSDLMSVGMIVAGLANPLVGGVTHVALYSAALSAAQLLAHYNARLSAPGVAASPQGIFDQQVRNDSHYEQMRQFGENWGYQFTCRPMQLESGEFPGRMCPRIREGHDTDMVLDHDNSTAPTVTINADDVADILVVDAQGLADPANAGQLFAEAINFAPLLAGGHLFPNVDYDSPGDIQQLQQLQQRADSLLALRSAPWVEAVASAPAKRELTDTFPLTGALAEFAWLPGDGLRREWPLLAFEDSSPAQILGVQWPIFPTGVGAPAITFKNRPRSMKETLRRMWRESVDESRNYQNQFTTIPGSMGGEAVSGGGVIAQAGCADAYSRLPLPSDLSRVIKLEVVVMFVTTTGGTTWSIEIGGTATGIPITKNGRYDVTSYLTRLTNQSQVYCRLTTNLAGSGQYQLMLEALVRI